MDFIHTLKAKLSFLKDEVSGQLPISLRGKIRFLLLGTLQTPKLRSFHWSLTPTSRVCKKELHLFGAKILKGRRTIVQIQQGSEKGE